MHLLWNGVADYVLTCGIEIPGVASFPGTDPEPIAEVPSYLHLRHPRPPDLAGAGPALLPHRDGPAARRSHRAVARVAGGSAADHASSARRGCGRWCPPDRAFNTIDVCVVITTRMTERYRAFTSAPGPGREPA